MSHKDQPTHALSTHVRLTWYDTQCTATICSSQRARTDMTTILDTLNVCLVIRQQQEIDGLSKGAAILHVFLHFDVIIQPSFSGLKFRFAISTAEEKWFLVFVLVEVFLERLLHIRQVSHATAEIFDRLISSIIVTTSTFTLTHTSFWIQTNLKMV